MGDTSKPSLSIIIILGCPPVNQNGEPNPTFESRVTVAKELYLRAPGNTIVIVIPTGYQAAGYVESEASAMKRILLTGGVKSEDIILEEDATSTIGNAVKCRPIVTMLMEQHNVTDINIVTSAFHVPRSRYIFTKLFSNIASHSNSAGNSTEDDGVPALLKFHESPNCFPDSSSLESALQIEELSVTRMREGRHRSFNEALQDIQDGEEI